MVRTRIAPSPTGSPHIGTAFIALANQLFAEQQGGQFLLRLEDTDRERSEEQHEAAIMNSLNWLGLSWAEGPDVGGDCGPYRQSDRLEVYKQHIEILLEKGEAFFCFCSKERLDEIRQIQKVQGKIPKYDGHCMSLSKEEVETKIAAGEPHVIRMKVPATGSYKFKDPLKGEIEIPWENVDMQVLMKTDGFPTYHFANVVDDHAMKITHVIRGEEWVASLPKHALLYDYFGFEKPEFVHLPLLRNKDRSKLSKRESHTSILWFDQQGYLPEAVLNQLDLILAPADDEGEELRSFEEMKATFDLYNIHSKEPIFDLDKLNWLNGRWLRERLSDEEFIARFHAWSKGEYEGKPFITELLNCARERVVTLAEVPALLDLVYNTQNPDDPKENIKLSDDELKLVVATFLELLASIDTLDKEAVGQLFADLAEKTGLSKRKITVPFYIATQGQPRGLPLYDVLVILGQTEVEARVKAYQALI